MIGKTNLSGSKVTIDGVPVVGKSNLVYKNEAYYDFDSWISVSTIPNDFRFCNGSAVVYNNEIHILGGLVSSGYEGTTTHYKWNGSKWISASTLPYNFYQGSAVVYNNEIHILGSNDSDNYVSHYSASGSKYKIVYKGSE